MCSSVRSEIFASLHFAPDGATAGGPIGSYKQLAPDGVDPAYLLTSKSRFQSFLVSWRLCGEFVSPISRGLIQVKESHEITRRDTSYRFRF